MQPSCLRDRQNARLGEVVWRFIDRMTDVCEIDPADRILQDFVRAVDPLFDDIFKGEKVALSTETVKTSPLDLSMMRRFVLDRTDDESGISGKGTIAEGVQFSTGWCALSWLTKAHSVGVYPNITELERVHGHNGATVIRWID